MSNVVVNANGSSGQNMLLNEEDDSPASQAQVPMAFPRMPSSEAEADEMLANSLGNDPVRMRLAALEFARKMDKLASAIDGGVPDQFEPKEVAEQKPHVAPAVVRGVQLEPSAPAGHVQVPPTPFVPIISASAPEPERGQEVNVPAGYLDLPEALYTWSPADWGGRILHGVPEKIIEYKDSPALIIFALVEPAFARDRAGRIVDIPGGARVVIRETPTWWPAFPVIKSIGGGRPLMYVIPTARGADGRIRQARVGEEPVKYFRADGGFEFGIILRYEPDHTDPSKPRLISQKTVADARPEQKVVVRE